MDRRLPPMGVWEIARAGMGHGGAGPGRSTYERWRATQKVGAALARQPLSR
jgi:hypothetical protein